MKKDLLQSLKTIIFFVILFVGFGYVLATAPANPPSNNVAAPINLSSVSQVKGTGLPNGALLHIGGTLGANNLAVFGNSTITGNLNMDSLKGSGTKNICADNDGYLITCPLTATSPIILSTNNPSLVNTTTAVSGGNITSLGDSTAVSARGVVWIAGGTAIPALPSTSKTTDGSGVGSFTSNITGLSAGTTYGVRAYATNPLGITYYGDKYNFTTPTVPITPPSVTTTLVTNIAGTTATSGGTVSGGSGTLILEKGLMLSIGTTNVWNKITPSAGASTGSFVTNLTGLSVNTTYKVKAYAETNNYGTFYGFEISFTTTGGSTCGGYPSGGYCWYAGAVGQSCTTVCSGRGGCNTTDWGKSSVTCSVLTTLLGSGTCTVGAWYENHQPSKWNYGGSYILNSSSSTSCSAFNNEYRRVCACLI